ncbi:ATP-grasp domain-containing protein [Methylobacterium indicum]|uniref:ATP-grasp domain-containing protein n=1 Tax=Methylobacterium indicum TaxID=1775910 RepID=UPI002434DC55|nr:hypothetical protein [Methylobacterium indicum]
MHKAVYLSLGAPHLEYPAVEDALRAEGVEARMVHLAAFDRLDLDEIDLVNLRMCRWYHKEPDFRERVERVHERLLAAPHGPIPLANPLPLVLDALDKGRYLRKLSEDGIELVPTRWIAKGSPFDVVRTMDEAGWDDVVVKPTVSSGSWNTIRVSRSGPALDAHHFVLDEGVFAKQTEMAALALTHALIVQPFLPSVLDFGELSFVFLGGELSHVVRKTVGNRGGWWAHERLGGQNHRWNPNPAEERWATGVNDALERRYGRLWFARIDGLQGADGRLQLLECELAIPRLLLPEGKAFGRYATVMAEGIARHRPGRPRIRAA